MKQLQYIILALALFAVSCSNRKVPEDLTLQDYTPIDTISAPAKTDTIIKEKPHEEPTKVSSSSTAVIIVIRNSTICVVLILLQKMTWMTMVCSVTLTLMTKKHGIKP